MQVFLLSGGRFKSSNTEFCRVAASESRLSTCNVNGKGDKRPRIQISSLPLCSPNFQCQCYLTDGRQPITGFCLPEQPHHARIPRRVSTLLKPAPVDTHGRQQYPAGLVQCPRKMGDCGVDANHQVQLGHDGCAIGKVHYAGAEMKNRLACRRCCRLFLSGPFLQADKSYTGFRPQGSQ